MEQSERDEEVERNKPAMFRKQTYNNDAIIEEAIKREQDKLKEKPWKEQEYEAWKKLKEQTKMDFDPDDKSHDEMREFFRVSKEKNAIENMNEQVFDYLYQRMKETQVTFYAFLNKEFNVMNFKSARCSMHCFDSTDRQVSEVNECLKLCREGIQGCKQYAYKLQKKAEQEVEVCQNDSKSFKTLTDPVFHWVSCYEKLLLKFDNRQYLLAAYGIPN